MRLSPGDSKPVLTLLDASAPTRYFSHNHTMRSRLRGAGPQQQDFNALADASPVDSAVITRFDASVDRLLAGDQTAAPELAAQLHAWRDNDARFAAVAKGHPALEAALPRSRDLAELAGYGLDALERLSSGKPTAGDWSLRAKALVSRLNAEPAASADAIRSLVAAQPPADLLLPASAGVGRLVNAVHSQ